MKFYLVRPNDESSSIYVDINYKKNRVRISTGIVVECSKWNQAKEILNRKHDNNYIINNHLNLIKSNVSSFISQLKIDRSHLSNDEFKNSILKILDPNRISPNESTEIDINNNSKSPDSLINVFDEWILERRNSNKYSKSTLKNYRCCYNQLFEFTKRKRVEIGFERMNMSFYNKFTKYLNETGMVDNSVGVYIKVLKAFLREQDNKGVLINPEYKTFKSYSDPEPPTFALTDSEIADIMSLEILNNDQQKAKDLFTVQLHTLVRISNLMKIKEQNIDIDTMTISIFVKKTKRPLTLPITKELLEIFSKYDYRLPKMTDDKYNLLLKELAKLAGISKMVEIVRRRGALNDIQVLPKYAVMCSNMVRRSGITGLLRRKVPANMIMQISGHKKLSVFEGYVRMEQQDSLNAVRDAWDRE